MPTKLIDNTLRLLDGLQASSAAQKGVSPHKQINLKTLE